MRRPSPLPEDLDSAPFSTKTARDAGISRQRTRAATLHSPYFGVRTHHPPATTHDRAAAYAQWMSPTQFFSHLTAAELLGLRLPEGFRPGALHVSSTPPARAPRSRGVIGHQTRLLGAPTLVDGLRVSSAVDTWLALGSSLSIVDLIVMADGLLSRVRPATDLPALDAAVTGRAGRPGFHRLQAALRQVRANTDSARETMLRLVILRAGFPEPEVNGAIVNSLGAVTAHGDLVFREYRTILEYDGGHHRTSDSQFTIDVARLDELVEEGWRVIRVDKNLMARHATLIGKVETALTRHGWQRKRPR